MFILSVDVGIKNLSYTIIDIEGFQKFSIKKWDNTNLLDDYKNLKYMNTIYKNMTLQSLKNFSDCHNLSVTGKQKKHYIQSIETLMKQNKIKNKKYNHSLNEIAESLIKHLDDMVLWKDANNIKLDHIIIENQPKINFQMRNLQLMIFTYFTIKSDKDVNIECVSPSLKSKFCESYFNSQTDLSSYKNRKNTSIQIVQELIGESINDYDCWKGKKDDLADVICQAFGFYKKIFKKCL